MYGRSRKERFFIRYPKEMAGNQKKMFGLYGRFSSAL